MCFSASASFLASGFLIPAGLLALRLASTTGQARKLPLAATPLFFGLQQASEGVVWLGIRSDALSAGGGLSTTAVAALVFLFFAYAFWPVWMPLVAVKLLEEEGGGRPWPLPLPLRWLPLLGLVPAVLLWLPLLREPSGAVPRAIGHGLVYALPDWSAHLLPPMLGPALYAALIVAPLLLVPSGRVRSFALSLLAAFALTLWASSRALTSVWCFASALLSIQILWILQEEMPQPSALSSETFALPPGSKFALPPGSRRGQAESGSLQSTLLDPNQWSAEALVKELQLQPHPEGGWYREIHRSPIVIERDDGEQRSGLTLIWFLLTAGTLSRWHRVLQADETWHHAAGSSLELWMLPPTGGMAERRVLGPQGAGPDGPQHIQVVPAGWWQAARCLGEWTLVTCCVGPGFDFDDFQLLRDRPAADHPAGALSELL